MKTPLTVVAGVCCFLLLAGCSPKDRDTAREQGEKLKHDAKELGSKIETEARRVGATPESGSGHSAEEKLRQGAAALEREGKEAGAKLSQAAQTAKVKYNLTSALGVSATSGIDVDSNGNTVTLRGSVPSADQRTEAERVALSVDGVTKVINSLQIKP